MKKLEITPWATLHPGRVARIEKRDDALIAQSKKQALDDQRLLARAERLHKRDTKMMREAMGDESGDHVPVRGKSIARLVAKAGILGKALSSEEIHAGISTDALVTFPNYYVHVVKNCTGFCSSTFFCQSMHLILVVELCISRGM